jgi:hypothetical protein
MEMKKILVIGIIFLFIGVAVAPSINFTVVKASVDDVVEVTTQACGIKGYGNTTVKLTREQYRDLEQYLVEFRARLNQTSTREEAIPIFKDAVVELDKYGLLPKGMSVNRAFNLLTKINDQRLKVLDSLNLDPDANYFCLVSGVTSNTWSFGPFALFAGPILSHCMSLSEQLRDLFDYFYYQNHMVLAGLTSLLTISLLPIFLWSTTRGIYSNFLPFGLLSVLTFGGYFDIPADIDYLEPSSGWVYSIGINGVKKYQGSHLWGTVTDFENIPFLVFSERDPGAIGFTGLKLSLISSDLTFFLGFALKMKLST